MRNDDFSQSGNHPTANDDYDVIPAGSGASATGNTITGRGTVSGAAGADHAVGAHVMSISGAGGGDGSSMEAAGRYGSIKIDAQGNYTYTRNHGSPENVEDVFTYTLADKAGALDSARLIIRIDGKEEAKIQDGAQRIVAGNEVITLPAGVELSDIHVVGRDLVIDLPDGTQMVIVDGAVFVPQLALGDVELPADTLASLLIDSEPRPAAGPPQSSGGNFGEPVAPLDPGVPLGDLLPPTELNYTPPEFEETYIPQRPNEIDNPPIDASPITLEVDDDALPTGSNASSPDEVNSGILTFTAGTDALISFAFSTDLSHLSGALTWVRVSDTLIEGRDGGVLVISLELSAPGSIPGGTSGNVTVTATLSSNYDSHPGINADDLQSLGFIVVQAKEADGTIANGTVNVGVSDDVPHATGAEAASGIIVDETDAGSPAGFPIVRVSADPMISGAGNYGADGPAAVGALTYGLSLTGGAGSLATSLKTAAGDYPITLVQDPGNPTTITGTYNGGLVAFTLVMDPATGKLTYTQNVPLEHNTDGNTDAAYNDTDTPLSLGGLVNATVIVKDGDGDTDTASVPIGDRIVIYDDGPDAAVDQRAQFGPAILDETRGEGTDTPGGTSPNGLASTTINFSSAFLTPDFGADGAGAVNGGVSYQLILSGEDVPSGLYALEAGDTSDGDGDGYGQGDEIVLNIDGNTITGSAGGVNYFTISIDPLTGIVTFSQLNPIWHPTPGDFDELAMLMTESASDIVVRQTVTDADGDFDTADLNIGQGIFGIQDDGPDPFDGCPDEVIAINDVGSTFTGDLHLPDVGEDKPGVVTFNVMDGDPVLDTGGNPVSSSGGDLYYFINTEGVLEARAGGESGEVIFTITLNGDGTYTYDQLGDITSETELSITDLSSVGGGNVAAKAIDVEGSPFDLILSTKAGTTVNTNATEIGIGGGNSFESGEILRVDLVQNAFVTGSGGGAVLNFGEYYSANSYKQDVSGLGGAQKASFTVKVIAVHEAPGSNAADPADGDNVFYGDTNDTFVTGTTLHLYNGSGVLVDPANYAGLGITVTALADGWQIAGLPNNYDFQIVSTTAFNAVQIEAIAGTDTFKLGFIDITSTVQSNVDLQVPIALTDADGDSVTCDIDVHLGPPTNVPAVVATVNEAGLDGIGSDGASNSEITSGELSSVVSGGTGPYTYALVGSGDGTYGTLTIDPVTGHYQYVLDTPYDSMPDANNGTNTVPAADVFTYSVTDANGVVTQAQISINVVDDVPTANDDIAGLTEGGPSFVTFDVDTNDVPGADGTGSRVFTSLTGTYGNITLNPDGTQTYTLTAAGQLAIDALAPGATLTDSFTYNLTDGDGDVDPATVTITLTGTDDPVTITNLTPKANGGDAIVDEDDLLASRGVGESAGSDPTKESTTVTGDFNISAPDGLNALVIDGHTVISGGVFTAMSWTTPLGNTISITAFDAASGKVSYSYTLLDNEAHPNANGENSIFDDLNVHLSDVDGSTADSTLSIQIVDDVPTANDDAYEILEGDSDNAITLNVKANDVSGADGTGLPSFTSLTGLYGNIVVNSEGQQTYTLNATGIAAINALAPGATLTDTFTYKLTDGDGDTDPATVTITLKGTDDPVTITNLTPKANGGDAIVDEDDLLASRGVGESAGSDPTKESTTVTGDFNISAPDGLNALVIDGHTVISGGVFTAMSWTTPLGNTISITAFDAASGKVSYSYTLLDNEAHPNANGENSIFDDLNVHLSDVDGSTADSTLSIQIVDDVPTANDDAYEILEGDSDNAITLNVKANDVSGADGTGLPSFTSLTGLYGNIVVNSEGQQTYTLNATGIAAINALAPGATLTDTFTYKLTDGDGDTDPATVTITLKGTDDPVTITNLTPKANGGDAIVDEDDLLASRGVGESAGSDPTKESTTVTGDFNISAPDGLNALVIDGHTVISGGVFTAMSWTTPLGNTISITAFDAASGKVSYSYTLLDNEAHPNANGENSIFDDLNVHLSDVDGSTADSTLSIQIVDDVPTANDDAYEILEGDSDNAITLNVKANDVSGADGTGLPSFTSLTGLYGNIVVNSEGQQTYTLNATGIAAINALAPGATLTDTFTYKLTDGDGDTDPATVTITLKGTDDPVTITNLTPKANGGDAIVDEDDLLASRGVGESAGSDPTKESTTVTGDFNISAPDGLNALVIDGHTVISGGVFTAMSWTTPLGNTISITAFDAASGKVSYSYTLLDNEAHPNANGENSIFDDLNVHLSDVDGSTADSTLSIQIVDDVPTANDDAYEILEGDSDNAITLNVKANDVSGADGTGLPSFTSLTGLYGNIVVNSEGQQTYTLNATGIAAINALAPGATLTDTFTYKLTDGDGDTDPATVTITLKGTDDPVTITNLTPKANGGDAIVDEDDLLASRGVGESAGSDPTKESTTVTGDFNISAPDGLNALVIDGHTVISGGVFTAMSWTTPLGNTISITAFDAASGKVSYSYTLLDNEAHPNANGENSIFDDLNVHLSDVDGSTADSTLSIQIVDDVPGQSASQIVINLDEDELPGGITDGDSEVQSASGSLTSLVVMGADGLGSFAFDATALGGLPALTSGSQAVTWGVVGTQLVAYTGANSADASKYVLTISLTAGGNYTVTLLKPLDHVAGAPLLQGSGDDQDMTIDVSGAIKFTDADGDSVNLDANSLLIKVEDDIPTTFTPQAAVTTNNAAGIFNGALDFGDAAGLTNNYGADGGKAVFTLTGLPSTQTSGGVPLFYTLSNGDQTLTATAGNGGPVVYTATITGSTYTIDVIQPIDSLTTVDFINGAYDHPGGNPDYYAFYKAGNNDSSDLLLTAASGGTTVNLNSNLFGIGAGNSMDPGDSVRLDYVTDLVPTGTGAGQFTYEHHYNVNGATVGIAKANSATARFTAYDDPDGNNTVGDGVKDTINQVSLKYGAGTLTVVPTTTNTAYVVGGHTFWVLLNADGSVSVGGLAGDATGSVQSTVGIYTASGYNSLVVAYEDGPHGDDTFKIGGFGAAVPNTDPVIFDIPVKIVDNDDDSVAGSPIHVTLNTPAPPVVLDTNHDGQIGFLGIDHGVLYDMNGDGHLDHTAWVAPGDSILFFDADGNGTVSGASEFVFGYGNLTDLAALHAMYGDQLDAHDADFTMFALWNDANSNGIVDEGEIQTLAEAGITSISLVSDGVGSSEAGGDVAVSGSGSFTYVNDNGDLANGKLADASLGYRPVTAEEEQRLASTSTNSSLLAIAAAAAALADQAAASTPSGDDDASKSADPQVNVAPTATPATLSDDDDAAVSPLVAHNDSHVAEAAPAAHHNAVVAEESNVVIDSSAREDAGPSDLPQGSDLPAVDSTPLVDVAPLTVAAEAVAPDVGDKGGAHQNAVIAGDVIEHSGDLVSEALARFGGNDPIESLAQVQSGPKAVQGWDMADFGNLPAGVMEHIGAEASLLHPDAVQPVMHG